MNRIVRIATYGLLLSAETASAHHDQGKTPQSTGLRLYRFTEPLGIATFSFLD